MRLEEKLACNGLHGFGTGYTLGKANTPMSQTIQGKDSYCARGCALKTECWNRHRTKVQIMMPRGAQFIDKLTARFGQLKAIEIWQAWAKDVNRRYPLMAQKAPEKDPYLLQMVANLEDGYEYAKVGKVKNRGEFTLRYPMVDA